MELHHLQVEEYAGVHRVGNNGSRETGLGRGLGYLLTPHLEYYCASTGVWLTWIRVLDIANIILGAYLRGLLHKSLCLPP